MDLLHAPSELLGDIVSGQVDVGQCGVSRTVAGERGDRVQFPTHPGQVRQTQLPSRVRGELGSSAANASRLTTFDQVHRLSGAARLRRNSDKNNGPRARLIVAR